MKNKEIDQEELNKKEIEEEEKKKRRRYLLLLLILLLLLLLLCRCGRKLPTAILGEKIENNVTPSGYVESTGNSIDGNNVVSNNSVDDTTTDDNIAVVSNTTKNNKKTSKNTNTITNTTISTGGSSTPSTDDEDEANIKKEIIVTSNNQKWTEDLDIFSNEKYNGQSIIYPGIENTYYFEVTNASEIAVLCDLKFKETNLENLPIKYKLKENGVYVKGNQTEYVTYDKLALDDISLEINAQNVYALEWKWIDDETSDNYYGDIEKDITYALQIIVQAEEKTTE